MADMGKLKDRLTRPLEEGEDIKVAYYSLLLVFLVMGVICGALGIYNRIINKAQAVNEVHQDLVEAHDWKYCPYCGEYFSEDGE